MSSGATPGIGDVGSLSLISSGSEPAQVFGSLKQKQKPLRHRTASV
jgi:hypothetical protein